MSKITSTEEWQKAVQDHISKLDDEERYHFAHAIIFDVALWCGYNAYETVGILRFVEDELIESIKEVERDGDDE